MSRVYIGRLPPRCSERDIERFFKGYGRLRDIVLKNGYGFVEFDNDRDAEDAVYDLHGRDLKGERIIVEHARLPPGTRGGSKRSGRDRRYGPPTRTDYRAVVENLSSRVSWQDLKDMMRKAGDVTYADAHKAVRNEGIVEFSSLSDLKHAIEKFDGYELHGRRLKVMEDRPRRRSSSGSRSRSRSRTRRSRSRHSRSRSASRSRSHSRSRSRSKSRSVKRRGRSDSSRKSEDSRRVSRHDSSRSHSKSRSKSHHSRVRSVSVRSHHSKEVSRSPSRNGAVDAVMKERSRSKSVTRSPSHEASRSKSASRSPSQERSLSHRSRSASRSKSRSVSNDRSR